MPLGENIMQMLGQIVKKESQAVEQAMVAREVDRNLVTLRDLSFQTSAGANQTSASSQELANLAERLSNMLHQFRL